MGWILLVDDEASILNMLTEVLRDEGYDVAACSGGVLALEAIRVARTEPDLVILDMRMPGMDGWQLAAELRSLQVEAPLLVMTAGNQARQAAQDIGAAGFLGKPFDMEQFISSVASIASPR